MSLIAWWPLNGDTNNYGTLGAELQATFSPPDDDGDIFREGKIGLALYKGSLTLTGEQWKKIIGNTISIAMWIYTRNDGTYSAGVPFFGMSGMNAPNNRKFSMFHYNTKTNLHCSWQNDDSGGTYWSCHYSNFFELNKWVHLCVVQDAATNTITVYRNGEQYSKSTVSGLSSMNFKEAGTAPIRANIDYQHMSDLRIYNHALSLIEVKELSKALTYHYTFEDGALIPNVFDTSILLIDPPNRCTVTAYGHNGFTMTSTGSDPYIGTSTTSGGTVGTRSTWNVDTSYPQVCLSWKHVSGPELNKSYMTFLNSAGGAINTSHNNFGNSIVSNGDQRYVLQTLPEGTVKVHVRFGNQSLASGSSIVVDNISLKTGYNPTYSPPRLSSSLYNNTGLLQDTYAVNLYTIADGAIGNQSLECRGNTRIDDHWLGDITAGATISCWIKVSSYPTSNTVVFANYNSKMAFGFYGTQAAIISCGGYSAPYVPDIKSKWSEGWNHVVTTRSSDGAINCYLNGELLSTSSSNNWTSTVNYTTIGCRHNGGYTNFFTGFVDDFRVYYTLLSADEIKSLYNCRWSSNKQGQVFSNMPYEGRNKFQITRDGVVNCATINESGILPNGYIPLHYIQSSGTQCINTNHLATANTRTIFDYEYLNASASWTGLFGSDNNPTNNDMGYGIFLNGSTYNCYVSNHTTGGCWNQQVGAWTQNQRTLLDFTHSKLVVNNIAYNLTTTTFTTSLVPIYLFSFRRSTGNAGTSSIRLYHCQIWEGATLVRNFIPAQRTADKMIGLYDTINNIFYTNVGSNNFIAGPSTVSSSSDGSLHCTEFNEI